MEGPDTPEGVAELAQALMGAAGVGKLRRDAVRLVVKGRTTIEEAMRISNQFED